MTLPSVDLSFLKAVFSFFANSLKDLPMWGVVIVVVLFALLAKVLITEIYHLLHTRRLIQDTPTSRIRSASQGQVEFIGTAESVPTFTLTAPLTNTRCVWYSMSVEREVFRSDGKPIWEMVMEKCSDDLFLIRDDTDICLVAPLGAQITTNRDVRWITNELPVHLRRNPEGQSNCRYRFFEAKIEVGDPIYVMGYFETTRVLQKAYQSEVDIDPKDQAYAAKNHRLRQSAIPVSGHIAHTFEQWEQIREQNLVPEFKEETVNIIHYQKYLRLPYMISNYSEKKLARYYLLQAMFYISLLMFSLWLPLWLLDMKFL